MAFRTTLLDDGTKMWLCGEAMEDAEVCKECGHLAENLCDFPIGGDKTCDAAICERHSLLAMENTHYCPPHAKEYGLFQPVTKPAFRLAGQNDNKPWSDGTPPKRRKRLPRKVA